MQHEIYREQISQPQKICLRVILNTLGAGTFLAYRVHARIRVVASFVMAHDVHEFQVLPRKYLQVIPVCFYSALLDRALARYTLNITVVQPFYSFQNVRDYRPRQLDFMVQIPRLEYDPFLAAPIRVYDVVTLVNALVVTPEAPALEQAIFVAKTSVLVRFTIEITLVILIGLEYLAEVYQELVDKFLTAAVFGADVQFGGLEGGLGFVVVSLHSLLDAFGHRLLFRLLRRLQTCKNNTIYKLVFAVGSLNAFNLAFSQDNGGFHKCREY